MKKAIDLLNTVANRQRFSRGWRNAAGNFVYMHNFASKQKVKDVCLNLVTIFYAFSLSVAILNYGAADALIVTLLVLPIVFILLLLIATYELPQHVHSTFWVVLVILSFTAAWISLQNISLANGFPAYPASSDANMHGSRRASISATPADDWVGYLKIALSCGVFLIGLLLFSTDSRARRALIGIAIIGGGFAVFSIFQYEFYPRSLMFGAKFSYFDSLTAPFVNRNTAATFYGVLVLLQFVIAKEFVARIPIRQVVSHWQNGRRVPLTIRRSVYKACYFLFLLLACLVALLMTKSRAGVMAALVGAMVLVSTSLWQSELPRSIYDRIGRQVALRVALAVGGILLAVGLFATLGGRVIWRAEAQGADDGRFCVMPGIWNAVRDHFPFGSGLSSFIEIFPAYRDPRCGLFGTWDMAHNVYVEGLLTLGVAFVVIMTIGVLWLIRIFLSGILLRQRYRFGGQFGLAVLFLVAIHSAFDFSLQIAGFSIFLAAVLAPAATLSLRPAGQRRQRKIAVE